MVTFAHGSVANRALRQMFIGEDGKRSTITLGAIERLAGENLGVNLLESKQIVNRPAFPACDRR